MTKLFPKSDDYDALYDFVSKMADNASEHFDTVEILCTRHENNAKGSEYFVVGRGNWYARKGQITEWLLREDEDTRYSTRKRREENE